MSSANNLERPGGLDVKQFVAKFESRISREGKYQTKVCLRHNCVVACGARRHGALQRSIAPLLTAATCVCAPQDVFAELDADGNGFVSRLEMAGVKAFLTPQDL
jgi:hypothetical protein